MKEKGFTLIELLAVIVILAVIGLITIPMIGNVIEDSKKKSLEQSVYGIVEAANYFAISNDGIHKFVFNEEVQGKTEEGDFSLDYKGSVDATGELYIDNDGNISLCLMNENYYVYKNYNSGIYVGNVSEDTCIVDYDALTNKYIAMLDDGSGTVSNVYSTEEVDNLVTNLQSQISSNDTDIETLNTLVNTNVNEINSLKMNVNKLSSNIEKYKFSAFVNEVEYEMNFSTGYSGFLYETSSQMVTINMGIAANSQTSFSAGVEYLLATLPLKYAPVMKRVFPVVMALEYDTYGAGATLFKGIGCIDTDGTISVKFEQDAASGFVRYITASSVTYSTI